jgi:hypothetical protein
MRKKAGFIQYRLNVFMQKPLDFNWAATPEKRNDFELSPRGIHWDLLDVADERDCLLRVYSE